MKTYAIICHETGRKFSFNADHKTEAMNKMRAWARYHGDSPNEYHVHQIPDEDINDLHNEYVSDL